MLQGINSCKLEHMSYRIVKASELAEYAYCRRAWWYSHVAGVEPLNEEARATGTAHHARHHALVRRAAFGRRLALVLVFLSVCVFVFVLVRGL